MISKTVPGVQIDLDLIRRYGVQGPRYTSYPTAVQFGGDMDEADYREAVARSNTRGGPLSIYVHIPYCRSLCYYCGCTKIITQHPERATPYLESLLKEIALQSALFDEDREVTQLHLGGGTPTFMQQTQLTQLVDELRQRFSFAGHGEYSIEIDPRTVDNARVAQLLDIGFNRLSMGVQDFDVEVQRAVNRIQSVEHTLGLIEAARRYGFKSVSVDLIYGLPLQTVERFNRTLEEILSVRPDRLALYSYAHLPDLFRAQRLIPEQDLPTAEEKLDLLMHSVNTLTRAGYVFIGMDHFALPDDELAVAQANGTLHRNFQGYSTRAECDLIGFGISAIGKIDDCFSQNVKKVKSYAACLDQGQLPIERGLIMNRDDHIRAAIIQSIMCRGVLDFAEIESDYDVSFTRDFASELTDLEDLCRDGLVDLDSDGLSVTSRGRMLVRVVAMVFDRYLRERQNLQRFSKVI